MRRYLLVILIVAAGLIAGTVMLLGDRARPQVTSSDAAIRGAGGVQLASKLLIPHSATADDPAPAVLLAHGLGEDQKAMRSYAKLLAGKGFVVRTWTSRGTPTSRGKIGIAAPDGEVADVSAIIDELATHPEVQLDAAGDPRVGVLGVSHGGGVAVLAAAADERIDAVVPIFAWFDLAEALQSGGVLKLGWASELFAAGSVDARHPDPCGNLTREVCTAWTGTAERGALTDAARELLATRSPSSQTGKLRAPTLIIQGQMDSLFDLNQATSLAAALERASVPMRLEWLRAGHDAPLNTGHQDHLNEAILRWFERHLNQRAGVEVGPRFSVELGSGRGFAQSSELPPATSKVALPLAPEEVDDVDSRDRVRIAVPPAGLPAESTTLPGLGNVTALQLGFPTPPGQHAAFLSEPASAGVEIIGAPRVTLNVASTSPDAVLFVRLVDVAADGRRLIPRGLVTPVRLRDLPSLDTRRGQRVDVQLPPIAWRLARGHRFGIEVASTDAGYVAPPSVGVVSVSVAGEGSALVLPQMLQLNRAADAFTPGRSWRDLLVISALLSFVVLGIGLIIARRIRLRDEEVQDPSGSAVPLSVDGLTKRFGRGRTVVDGATFTVGAGSIVGLVGPNGAGKTTTIRMLLGLVRPDAGVVHVFGQRVRAGVPQLARIGALIDGPGLVPHLSGRAHLERYWTATGRPLAQAEVEQALAAVDLLDDAHRPVRTWSQGMRQRLGIAQALLGSPELVLLDEPANGLDPAQIAHLRELVRSIAADGRTVLLSSHLLGELEQVCTHVVLMIDGRVLESGTLADVVGEHADLETSFLARVAAKELPDA
ncbi:MAG: alpha/beta fold hydrolase [Gaiellales bacterium]